MQVCVLSFLSTVFDIVFIAPVIKDKWLSLGKFSESLPSTNETSAQYGGKDSKSQGETLVTLNGVMVMWSRGGKIEWPSR